jgi:hypothetical protein
VRIEMRLGEDHAIAVSHESFVDELASWLESMEARVGATEKVDTDLDIESARRISAAFTDFRTACRSWFEHSPIKPTRRWPMKARVKHSPP